MVGRDLLGETFFSSKFSELFVVRYRLFLTLKKNKLFFRVQFQIKKRHFFKPLFWNVYEHYDVDVEKTITPAINLKTTGKKMLLKFFFVLFTR